MKQILSVPVTEKVKKNACFIGQNTTCTFLGQLRPLFTLRFSPFLFLQYFHPNISTLSIEKNNAIFCFPIYNKTTTLLWWKWQGRLDLQCFSIPVAFLAVWPGPNSQLRRCVKEEVDVLGSQSLTVRTVSVDVNQDSRRIPDQDSFTV